MIVDGDVHVFPAGIAAPLVPLAGDPGAKPVEAPESFDIQMQQVAWIWVDISAHAWHGIQHGGAHSAAGGDEH